MQWVNVEKAEPGGPSVLVGRPSSTREEWEAARAADALDLNRLLESGGEVEAYIAPLWSNGDAQRCIQELRGFEDARVYAALASGDDQEGALATIAEAEWLGVAYLGDDFSASAALIHVCAGLEVPVFLDHPESLRALALTIGEDLSPREIESVLRGEWKGDPDEASLEHARELMPEG